MDGHLSETTLSGLSAFLAREMGLLFPRDRRHDLERGIAAASRRFGFADPELCARWLLSAPLTHGQIETLAGFLTVGETYFFRDPGTLGVVESVILPELTRSRRGGDRRLRIWSAGCSTGEEPYSIAILLHRMLPDLERWKVTILATDINQAALQKAAAGVYGDWSFRAAPSWLKAGYFAPADGGFLVDERIRRMVVFAYLNLAEDSYPSLATNTNAMDLIFCRNVLLYFTPETLGRVVEKLYASLVEKGWLVTGPVDLQKRSPEPFEAVRFPSAVCYRKREAPLPDVSATKPEPEAPEPQPEDSAPPAVSGPAREAAEQYRRGRYDEAAAILTELRGRGKMPAESLTLLVRAHANRGRLAEARRVCEEVLRENRLDPALHCLRAEILQEQGEVEEARSSLKRALYLDPKLVLAHFALGNLTFWRGETEKAYKHFENALALLDEFAPDAFLPGGEGVTAGRLREIVRSMMRLPGGAGRGRQ